MYTSYKQAYFESLMIDVNGNPTFNESARVKDEIRVIPGSDHPSTAGFPTLASFLNAESVAGRNWVAILGDCLVITAAV